MIPSELSHRHAVDGNISPLEAESIAGDHEELSLAYRYDVVALRHVTNEARLERIERVGIEIRQPLRHRIVCISLFSWCVERIEVRSLELTTVHDAVHEIRI